MTGCKRFHICSTEFVWSMAFIHIFKRAPRFSPLTSKQTAELGRLSTPQPGHRQPGSQCRNLGVHFLRRPYDNQWPTALFACRLGFFGRLPCQANMRYMHSLAHNLGQQVRRPPPLAQCARPTPSAVNTPPSPRQGETVHGRCCVSAACRTAAAAGVAAGRGHSAAGLGGKEVKEG